MIDAIACEPQFLDHLAPLWRALPDPIRGRFIVDRELAGRALAAGIAPVVIDANSYRRLPQADPVYDGHPTLAASIGDMKIARRMGQGPFAFLEHGIGQSYLGEGPVESTYGSSYPGGPDRGDVELFLVPGHDPAGRWMARYPAARVRVVGSPRLEDLPRREPGPGPVVAVSFHWDVPTGAPQDGRLPPEAGTAIGDGYLDVLPELAKRFRLIGHAHPRGDWPRRLERDFRKAGIEFVPEFADVCRRADLYVCDNSSTIYEFAATGRPVVLLNAKAYRREVHHGLRFWDAATVGMQVGDPARLGDEIESSLRDTAEHRQRRERALRLVYGVRHGSARVAAGEVAEWLAARQEVAA